MSVNSMDGNPHKRSTTIDQQRTKVTWQWIYNEEDDDEHNPGKWQSAKKLCRMHSEVTILK